MRLALGLLWLSMIALALILGPFAGCTPDQRIADEAYERGYADGFAAAQEDAVSVEEAYALGYEDGLAAGEEKRMTEVCQSCYGLGFSEGYEYGYADGSAARDRADMD